MLRRTIIATLCLLFAGALGDYQAEVRVRTTPAGVYEGVEIFIALVNGECLIWAPRRTGPSLRGTVLNSLGDYYGDSFPRVAYETGEPHYPWVVWSRSDGFDRDLVWSRWDFQYRRWTDQEWVTNDPSDNGDDLDPDVRFDGENKAHLFWWRNVDGVGSVFFSTMVADGWTYPYMVSEPGVDSRYPDLTGFAGGGAVVEYDTPEGPVTQLLVVDPRPDSITEDIDPLITVTTIP